MSMDFYRQLDILDPALLEDIRIVQIGVGGLGSPTSLVISKMGCQNLTIFDPEKVEDHNLPNQMHRLSSVGKPKVNESKALVQAFAGLTPICYSKLYDGSCPDAHLVISGVDSIKKRKEIWSKIKSSTHDLYIDARMGAELGKIYCLDPLDELSIECYESTLVKAASLPCTGRSIIYVPWITAGLIARLVSMWARTREGGEDYKLPFFTHIAMGMQNVIPPVFEQSLEEFAKQKLS